MEVLLTDSDFAGKRGFTVPHWELGVPASATETPINEQYVLEGRVILDRNKR